MEWTPESFVGVEQDDLATVGRRKLNVLRGDLFLPVLIVKESALSHNIEAMARYCEANRVSFAPHVKTTMSPQIIERQIKAGVWGITVATVSQLRVVRGLGAPRVLIANEVLDAASLRWLGAELGTNERLSVFCLVDSIAAVQLMSKFLSEEGLRHPLPVLVEIGVRGGRAGCRSVSEAREVAKATNESPFLRLAGVEGFEAVVEHLKPDNLGAAVDEFLLSVRQVAETLISEGFFADAEEVIVSAGGSAYFDRAVALLRGFDVSLPVRTVIRSGAYVLHEFEPRQTKAPSGQRREAGVPSGN